MLPRRQILPPRQNRGPFAVQFHASRSMPLDPLSASKAYQQAAKAASRAAEGGAEGEGVDFGKMVQRALTDAVDASRVAEKAGVLAVSGRADIVDVVAAISQAEATLETVVTVRDQVIQAYKEILNMPI
jgi:flagellar hook-basal body complex protein FliE